MAHIVCADCSLCGLHTIDVISLSYPSPSLLPLPPVVRLGSPEPKIDFDYTLLEMIVKRKLGCLSEKVLAAEGGES
jgi:hypothetical protein